MSIRDDAQASFRRDTRGHTLKVIHEGGPDGLVRYLRADRDGSSIYHFNIVTWPGYLSITGDMGSFTFARTRDMFDFFGEGRINPGYWSEKLQHPGGSREVAENFCADKFHAAIRDDLRGWIRDADRDACRAILPIARELLDAYPDSMHDAMYQIEDQTAIWDREEHGDHPWTEFWDHNCQGYRYDFLWCCHAITWAVKRYRQIKEGRTQAEIDHLILTGAA